ncbi:MAG: endonuclease, partial [Cyanobacteria bacterium J06633_1]
ELHYDNDGTDTGEAIEIAGSAGTDLSGWSVELYNGNGGSLYNTTNLSGTIPDQDNGFGTVAINYPSNGIQNGSPDGIALVDSNGEVVQFLSYEGSFTAVGGTADGQTSTDIGVAEDSSTPTGFSLQLTGTGTDSDDFTWNGATDDSFGSINAGQSFGCDGGTSPNIVINEVDADTPGSDSAEFIELYDGGAGNTSLDGLVAVLYNGNGDTSYAAFDLDGFSTDGNGFFVLGNEDVANVGLTINNNSLQNGADAVALYLGDAADFSNGTAVTSDGLIDAIVYDTGDGDDSELLNGLGQDAQFDEGANGDKDNQSNSRVPDGTGSFIAQSPTPGATIEFSPPPAESTPIYDIQGAALTSPLEGQSISTTGIVTALDSNGFYLQDPTGDNNTATSDGIFVFTSSAPGVSVGDELEVAGTVSEFTPGGTSTGNLSITQISNADISTISTGNTLPDAVIIGSDGRIPPSESIDDNPGNYNPDADGIDFFESVEGMLVTAQDTVAVGGTTRFGEIFTVVDGGANATGISDRGTLNISPDDFNPEKIQIDEDTDILPGFDFPDVDTGASLGDVTGVVGYSFGNFEIYPTQPFSVTDSGLTPEVTNIQSGEEELTIATYNVLNLDPNDSDGDTDVANGRYEAISDDIVNNLDSPNIVGLQEVQDNSGSADDGVVAADLNLQQLADEIAANGGPQYEFIDNTFIDNNSSGGQPGGNIRNAFLYDPNRVNLVDGSVESIGTQDSGAAFDGARLPLVADFEFNGQEVTVINNHFSSKGGSSPIFGTDQPFEDLQENPNVNGSLDERQAQAQAVDSYVEGILADSADANIVTLGDLNEFEFISPVDERAKKSGGDK